jgi:hypothetical protein
MITHCEYAIDSEQTDCTACRRVASQAIADGHGILREIRAHGSDESVVGQGQHSCDQGEDAASAPVIECQPYRNNIIASRLGRRHTWRALQPSWSVSPSSCSPWWFYASSECGVQCRQSEPFQRSLSNRSVSERWSLGVHHEHGASARKAFCEMRIRPDSHLLGHRKSVHPSASVIIIA